MELAHKLGMTVVAEGVEDMATLETLDGIGCDAAQGYAIARPMRAEELSEWLAGQRAVDLVAKAHAELRDRGLTV